MLQVKIFKFQFKRAALAGFQPPITLRTVVVGHGVVGRRERASGSGEIAPTTYRRKRWNDAYRFLSRTTESSCLYQAVAPI